MILLTLPYFLVALFLGGAAFWNGEIALGFATIGASYLAMGAGMGARSLFDRKFDRDSDVRKQALVMVVLTALMLAASLVLMHYFDVSVGPISGIIFALIGVGIGFFADMSPDAQAESGEPAGE